MYFRDTDAVILVFDVTVRGSFESLKNDWVKDVADHAPAEASLFIVGNKTDLLHTTTI